ncbi:serine/threonine protein kinase [Vibrio sp. 10N.222.54.F12]|uniref:serine/threonine protein kinase n=1 Tax=Vibrio TaxID=662 RepID=UPI0002F6B5B2|nr:MULTISPECIES: protein kinase [Vibrio]OEF65148.1 protein kinase [Vibrio tasmaniensis 1F-187]PML13240.1 protein kinase [Vibrio tasmaniensis]PML50191.1 protein kinase [Vibrio tasmaniensis]
MPEKQGTAKGYLDKLVVKAIEKKNQQAQDLANKNKPKLEYVIFSQFDVLDTLPSKNGKTTVYHLAKKGSPEKQVCCKVLNENSSDVAHELLIGEASRLEMSQHPSVADFIKIGKEFERPYFMYHWIQGESLAEKMARHSPKGFRHDHIAWLIYQLSGALEFMHTRGVCHLDIKPSNIIVTESDYVKLIDFGAARYVGESNTYAEASMSYASPAFLKSGMAQPQDDVYSLALLTGHLFLGAVFGDAWATQLKAKKRPTQIPNHVWKLIKEVIGNPRQHRYTATSFAQQLAKIDTQKFETEVSAPLFSSLRNADLVLTKHSAIDRIHTGRLRYLEASLVLCVAIITGTYLYNQTQPEWKSIVKSSNGTSNLVSTIKPAQTASFLAQSPWDIEFALEDMEKDVVSTAPYREAYEVQQSKLAQLYKNYESDLSQYAGTVDQLPKTLKSIRKKLVSLREKLNSDGALFPYADKALTDAMASINKATIDSQNIASFDENNEQRLVDLILDGKSEVADSDIETAWKINQSKAYFYSHVLPQKVLNGIDLSIENNAEQHYYSKAIDEAEAAQSFFGNTPKLKAKVRALKVARSEFILFSTVTEQSVFGTQKLHDSLVDLEINAPKKFEEITEILNSMASDSIDKSHQLSKPARGAIAIERAIRSYNSESRG